MEIWATLLRQYGKYVPTSFAPRKTLIPVLCANVVGVGEVCVLVYSGAGISAITVNMVEN